MAKLQGRVALVTGGGRGIGRAIALAFAAEGARVALTARTAAELEGAVAAIREQGGQATALTADLADRSAVQALVGRVQEAIGALEVLVNNAGVGSSADPRPVLEYDDAFWDLTLAVNLTAPYLLCKAVLPGMVARRWGRIINVASLNQPHPVATCGGLRRQQARATRADAGPGPGSGEGRHHRQRHLPWPGPHRHERQAGHLRRAAPGRVLRGAGAGHDARGPAAGA
jgi:NAD(P)-dependent dehydrogenase (short-subunit alcohol dehydrogenase family)